TLLFELGLARTSDAGWADVFRLAPSLDLPLFAQPGERPCDERTLDAFRRAHHCACFYSVLVDRMADQQAATTPERERLAAHFLSSWRQSLTEADGERAHAVGAVDHGARALRCGANLERAALARQAMGLRRYGHSILLKLGWASTASECLLRHRVEAHRLGRFRSAFNLLAMALQVVDDAEDGAEDEAVRGTSFPAMLGFPPAAFFTAGAMLTRAAMSAASQGGFEQFAQWLTLRSEELDQLRKRHVRPGDNLAGMVIASSLEAVCLSVARRTRGSTAATTSFASSM
ncbi:hypothetical protein, partial [Hyalangium sp.]|uniref:hypothetical protein n=1 Tax=Hyalangium sp. TaxID=2028555 RepID=UPI002D3BC725